MNADHSPIKQSPLSFKIILLGDSNIGKTSFIRQFIDNQFNQQTRPTISVDFISKTYKVDQFTVKLNIFDTAGQERYRSLTKAYVKGTDAVLFMYSMQSKQSFQNVKEWIKYYQSESENKDELRVLVGTKKDLLNPQNVNNKIVEKDILKQFLQSNNFVFKFQTSSKQNININIVFEQLSRNLIYNSIKRKRNDSPINQSQWPTILSKEKQEINHNNCC